MNDCEAIGRSVSLNEQQILELSKLKTGAAVVMQNNWCDAVLAQIHRYCYDYEGELPAVSTADMLAFKCMVIGALLDQYAFEKTRNAEKILEAIDGYSIDEHKKADAKQAVGSICEELSREWRSSHLGSFLLRYAGLDSSFRRAERMVVGLPKKSAKSGEETDFSALKKSADEFFGFLNDEIAAIYPLDARYRSKLIQYAVFAKSFERSKIDYFKLYQIKYTR